MGITDFEKEKEMEEEDEGKSDKDNLEVEKYFAVFYDVGCIIEVKDSHF